MSERDSKQERMRDSESETEGRTQESVASFYSSTKLQGPSSTNSCMDQSKNSS